MVVWTCQYMLFLFVFNPGLNLKLANNKNEWRTEKRKIELELEEFLTTLGGKKRKYLTSITIDKGILVWISMDLNMVDVVVMVVSLVLVVHWREGPFFEDSGGPVQCISRVCWSIIFRWQQSAF